MSKQLIFTSNVTKKRKNDELYLDGVSVLESTEDLIQDKVYQILCDFNFKGDRDEEKTSYFFEKVKNIVEIIEKHVQIRMRKPNTKTLNELEKNKIKNVDLQKKLFYQTNIKKK